ncbi:sulfurtransferase TusA family protein [Nocardioides sambongensis]|uniref:sulfurtransferase TusA family protein n=1 Tax=Nocardioides sambongensis TaxID=2589074 RepID=UPI001E5BF4E8|nr:sulfurtransferase TusA family protein [Nocardioides sambongensis]
MSGLPEPSARAPIDLELDCTDLPCPRPIIELARALPRVEVGGVLAVLARDPAARHDVPAWCRMREQEYLGEETAADGTPRYVVRRRG